MFTEELEKLDILYEDSRQLVFRAKETPESEPVIIKTSKQDSKFALNNAALKQEFEWYSDIKGDFHLKPLRLIKGNKYVQILDNFTGYSLKKWIQKNDIPDLKEFLKSAIRLSKVIADLHSTGYAHRNINSHNILISSNSKKMLLINFEQVMSIDSEDRSSDQNVVGVLSYISPEQTGLTNKSVSYLTDFYSLGVVFYEMLTGHLPFPNEDRLDLIHAHLAKTPQKIEKFRPDIPQMIPDIIYKCLSKNAEDRYKSAKGLIKDLEICLEALQTSDNVPKFQIGEFDDLSRFSIVEKLYGREAALQKLNTVYNLSCDEKSQLILITGASGIGKSSLVSEVNKIIALTKGYFIKGKFNAYERDIPYSGIKKAIDDWAEQIKSEGGVSAFNWQTELSDGLGTQIQIIAQVIPEIKKIMGNLPQSDDVQDAFSAKMQFHIAFQQFIDIIKNHDRPLILFLDDLQWADSSSLDLIHCLLSDLRGKNLLIIGSYRDNEVGQSPALSKFLSETKKLEITSSELHLGPIKQTDIHSLICDSLVKYKRNVKELASLIYSKTQGNPFFVRQFLKNLKDQELLNFDFSTGIWTWDIKKIREQNVTDNVVELVSQKIHVLSEGTQNVLKTGACIGQSFDIKTLLDIAVHNPQDLSREILEAIKSSFITPKSNNYKLLSSINWDEDIDWNEINFECRFIHDKVYESALSLLTDEEKETNHYHIGKYLLSQASEEELTKQAKNIVIHLNEAKSYTDKFESSLLAKLNLMAGQDAKQNAAYDKALKFFSTGFEQIKKEGWKKDYELTYKLTLGKAECEYLNKEFKKAEKTFNYLVSRCSDNLDKVNALNTLIIQYTNTGKYTEALETGNRALSLLKKRKLHLNPSLIRVVVEIIKIIAVERFRPISSLYDLDNMSDKKSTALITILNNLGPPSYFISQNLMSIIQMKMVRLSITKGNASVSTFGYSTFGIVLGPAIAELFGPIFGQYSFAYKFGQLALKLNSKYTDKASTGRSNFIFASFINHWKKPLYTSMDHLKTAYNLCSESGDLIWAGYSTCTMTYTNVALGKELDEISKDCDEYLKFSEQTKHGDIAYDFRVTKIWINSLSKGIAENGKDEKLLKKLSKLDRKISLHLYYFYQMMTGYLFDNLEQAQHYCSLSKKLLDVSVGFIYTVDHYFYEALIICSKGKRTLADKMRLRSIIHKFKVWDKMCPENFRAKLYLIQAERARCRNNVKQTLFYFQEALVESQKAALTHIEALTCELTGRYWETLELPDAAENFLKKAKMLYISWGAFGKAEHLTMQYPVYLYHEDNISDNSVVETDTSDLEKELSQTSLLETIENINRERDLKRLQKTILQILVKVAGAERGIVILKKNDDFFVNALFELKAENRVLRNLKTIPYEEFKMISKHVVDSVIQDKTECIIEDAQANRKLQQDTYVQDYGPRSILCIPMMKQGDLAGILYLENNSATDIFSGRRVDFLKVLSSQIAIALENAQYFKDKQEESKKKQATLEKSLEKESTEKKKAMVAAQELAHQASFSTLTLGIAHEIRNPLSAMQGKAVHLRDRLTGKQEMRCDVDLSEFVWDRSLKKEKMCLLLNNDLSLVDEVWEYLVNQSFIKQDGEFDEKGFRPYSPRFRFKLDGKAAEFEKDVLTYILKTYTHSKVLSTLDMFDKESERVERISNSMMEYGKSEFGVAGNDFSDLVGDKVSQEIWDELVQRGYLDDKGMILDKFEPDKDGFVLDIDKKFKQYEDLIIDAVDSNENAKKVDIEINSFLKNIAELYEGKFKRKNIHMMLDLQDNLPPILGHREGLKRVFGNIFTNAYQAMESISRKEHHFYVKTKIGPFADDDSVKAIEVQFEDTGCGIPKDVLPRIMDPFFTKKSKTGGVNLGLGLSFVYGTVQRLGGKIVIESDESKGTTFKLFFPI